MTWNTLLRAVAALALALSLGGCLSSKRPLFEANTAVAALGNGGRYQAYEMRNNRFARDEILIVRRTATGYEFVNEKGAANPATFHRLRDGRLIGQFRDDAGTYGYVAVKIRRNTVLTYFADCADQDMAKLAPLGVEQHDKECVLDRVTDPIAVFSAIKFTKRPGKLVRLHGAGRTRR